MIPFGIKGLDQICKGGVIEGNSILVEGAPGTGKTLLSMQFVYNGAVLFNEMGIIISFEELPQQIYRDALNFGWDFRKLEEEGKLKIICTSPEVFQYDLEKVGGFFDKIALEEEKGVRIVIDSINHLRKIPVPPLKLSELLDRFIFALKKRNFTSIFIKDKVYSEELAVWGRYSVDMIIDLFYEPVKGRKRVRLIEIAKARGQDYITGKHPFKITQNGIEIYPRVIPGEVSFSKSVPKKLKRISSGIEKLDEMLGGGIIEGHIVLVGGNPGCGKTIFGIQFLSSNVEEGKNCLFVSTEEIPNKILQQANSLNLGKYFEDERIKIIYFPKSEIDKDELVFKIKDEIEKTKPCCLVFDNLTSIYESFGKDIYFNDWLSEFLHCLEAHKITSMFILEIPTIVGELKISDYGISFLADTIILMRYVEVEGGVEKAISILKQRSSDHEKEIKRYKITSRGIEIKEGFKNHENILAGTSRSMIIGEKLEKFFKLK
jgi:circadian clock protein KaiC